MKNTENQGNRIAISLAAAIMMVMPLTIGYYLVLAGFGQLDFPTIYIFSLGCLISMGGSALIAWVVYKLVIRLAPSRPGTD